MGNGHDHLVLVEQDREERALPEQIVLTLVPGAPASAVVITTILTVTQVKEGGQLTGRPAVSR